METEKPELDSPGGTSHIEAQMPEGRDIVAAEEHRANDDRLEEARGRNSDKIDKSYWYSWRFLGTMFAAGTSFTGGIGGK